MAFTNYDDIIDSRDVIDRIDDLIDERNNWNDDHDDGAPWEVEYPDEASELAMLQSLAEEASDYSSEWDYGETLIRDSYFAEYAQQLAEDIGAISSDQSWPLYCIDWEQAVRDLQQDYCSVTYDGVDYWIRSS